MGRTGVAGAVTKDAPVENLLIRKLERLGPLRDEERRALEAAALEARPVEAGQDLLREGERLPYCALLLDGFACRYKRLDSGRRQIVAFLVPGDICDLAGIVLLRADHSVAALGPAWVAHIPHATVQGWMREHEALGRALLRDVLIEASVFREWVANVGLRTPLQRVAHVLCELVTRLRTLGLVQDDACELPIGHADLADATGLSVVQVNRALQTLHADGLTGLGDGKLTVCDWPGLVRAAEFDPGYLHQLAAAA